MVRTTKIKTFYSILDRSVVIIAHKRYIYVWNLVRLHNDIPRRMYHLAWYNRDYSDKLQSDSCSTFIHRSLGTLWVDLNNMMVMNMTVEAIVYVYAKRIFRKLLVGMKITYGKNDVWLLRCTRWSRQIDSTLCTSLKQDYIIKDEL